MKKTFADKHFIDPVNNFIGNSKLSGIVLFSSATLALIIANSPYAEGFHHVWENKFAIGFGDHLISKSIHHWINDGLMAIFFFVVGLELKREILVGELKNPRLALLPIMAAIGGMLFPALIFTLFNFNGAIDGWGIPMATDIAFALGILYLLGDRVPLSLKVFLTAIAIVDDLGAVLVIAFFYTSEIDFGSLFRGLGFLVILIVANLAGVRNTLFYGIVGIAGVWLAFLLSGVHATIAAVLAAFTIPASTVIDENTFTSKLSQLFDQFKKAIPNGNRLVTHEQQEILSKIQYFSKNAVPPLQRLEHGLHSFVAFIVMPIFALSNAGVTFHQNIWEGFTSPVTMGIVTGLLLGKFIGVFFMTWLALRLKISYLPVGMSLKQVAIVGILAGVGFTMSLFIAGLAYEDEQLLTQAKLGVITASIIAGLTGYLTLKRYLKG
jgi:NhaA family Na+:H+ antiporter